LKADGEERCDADEWDAFESFVCERYRVIKLGGLDDEDLEQV
jgi:hypothetical protein